VTSLFSNKKNEVLVYIMTRMTIKTWCQVKEARTNAVWLHLSIEIKSSLGGYQMLGEVEMEG
jgi:hypothetical protein